MAGFLPLRAARILTTAHLLRKTNGPSESIFGWAVDFFPNILEGHTVATDASQFTSGLSI